MPKKYRVNILKNKCIQSAWRNPDVMNRYIPLAFNQVRDA